MSACLIVMYHYVRDLEHSRYPGIKGLDLASFKKQLDYLEKNYTPISAMDIHNALRGLRPLPKRSCLLTFDDGYLEHYTEVFPELARRGIFGCFYPPVNALSREKLLDVNKIHLLLAHVGEANFPLLLADFKSAYDQLTASDPALAPYESLWRELAKPGRFDNAETIFFKRMLQHALPEWARSALLADLWDKYMDAPEETLAREMYVSKDMLAIMAANNMHIGVHGATHSWLDRVAPEEQQREIRSSIELLADIHNGREFIWSIAYPYGASDANLRGLCARLGASFGLTTIAETASIEMEKAFDLPRMDANDLKGRLSEKNVFNSVINQFGIK